MTGAVSAAGRRTAVELRRAAVEAGAAWSASTSLVIVVLVAAALVPAVVRDPLRQASLAEGLYLGLAATGAVLAIGLAGIASLAQGAFMAIGVFATALLQVRAGWPLPAALVGGVIAAAAAGLVTGLGVARLRGAMVAVASWLLAWLIALALAAFPTLSGGSQGLVLPRSALGPRGHYELALALTALAALVVFRVREGPAGVRLASLREHPLAATTAGVPAVRLRLGAFVTAAAIAGLAGGLVVQLRSVADPTAYGPFLSFQLFVAVLLGGATAATGGLVGVGVLAALSATWTLAASVTPGLDDVARQQLDPVMTALLLLAVLTYGGRGVVPWLWSFRPPRPGSATDAAGKQGEARLAQPAPYMDGPVVRAIQLRRSFGALKVVDGVDVSLHEGQIHALVGPNGSGKTTVLRLLAGSLSADDGAVVIAGAVVTPHSPALQVRRGVVRTLQETAIFPSLTVEEHVSLGVSACRRRGGAIRGLLATPQARGEAAVARRAATEALELVSLEALAGVPAGQLSGAEQRRLMLAVAYATGARAVLVDEPSAGCGAQEVEAVGAVLRRMRARGRAVLLVEHNLALVRAVADEVTVMDAGRVLIHGDATTVLADAAVRRAYLGGRDDR